MLPAIPARVLLCMMAGRFRFSAGRFRVSVRHHVHMRRGMNLGMVHRRQQQAILQALKSGSELHTTPVSPMTTSRSHDILGRHGPSWAKRPTSPCPSWTSSNIHVAQIRPVGVVMQPCHDEMCRESAMDSDFYRLQSKVSVDQTSRSFPMV